MIITGPTGVGKTKVAIELANKLNGELINSDRLYFYSFFKIGTGFADFNQLSHVPHHLYAILKPDDKILTVNNYVRKVETLVPKILSRNKLPILEGCSSTYNPPLIERNKKARRKFYYSPIIGLICPKRTNLRYKANKRLNQMFDNGLLEELKLALKNGFRNSYVIKNSVVYETLLKHLDGHLTLYQAKKEILDKILNVVEMQLEKFKKIPEIIWIEHDPNKFKKTIKNIIRMM